MIRIAFGVVERLELCDLGLFLGPPEYQQLLSV